MTAGGAEWPRRELFEVRERLDLTACRTVDVPSSVVGAVAFAHPVHRAGEATPQKPSHAVCT